jgi:LacI family transcriptional regulator
VIDMAAGWDDTQLGQPGPPSAVPPAADLRAVARVSGVSIATVSRALNGRPEVSDATRALVVETARKLGYLPNQQARTLVLRRSDTVGLIWDTSYVATKGRQPFLLDLLVGLKMALAETDYHLMLLSPQVSDPSPDKFIRTATQHSLDGVALMAIDEHRAVDALVASGRPCVGLDLPVFGPRATYVSSDNRAGAASAVLHLHSLGHRRIAMISGPSTMLPATQRLDGYRITMAQLRLDVPADYVVHGDFFLPSGRDCMRRLLELADRPTAVFVAGDEMAVGAVRAILEAGLHVPNDISIVGYDDVEVAALVRPSLTTIAQDYLGIGRAAVAVLTNLMDGVVADQGTSAGRSGVDGYQFPPQLLPGRLIVRESSGPVPPSGRQVRSAPR